MIGPRLSTGHQPPWDWFSAPLSVRRRSCFGQAGRGKQMSRFPRVLDKPRSSRLAVDVKSSSDVSRAILRSHKTSGGNTQRRPSCAVYRPAPRYSPRAENQRVSAQAPQR
ncbi:hypothetical protein O3P69_016487 [Scylla paramamosain]|uniref:Uncharacterized protein n=1 Tax=Scylla paramamosain TaxID=85552 RepID=A0AAW0TDG6_SCYPA